MLLKFEVTVTSESEAEDIVRRLGMGRQIEVTELPDSKSKLDFACDTADGTQILFETWNNAVWVRTLDNDDEGSCSGKLRDRDSIILRDWLTHYITKKGIK